MAFLIGCDKTLYKFLVWSCDLLVLPILETSMKKFLLLAITLISSTLCVGQDDKMKIIIDDYCERAKTINWDNISPQELANQITQISLDINRDHQTLIDSIKTDLKVTNPSLSEHQRGIIFFKIIHNEFSQ